MARLTRLLRPKSVAVIGGGVWCENVIRGCRTTGFAGEIWPVHPSRDAVGGIAAFASVAALPGPPDAAFIGVNRHATIEAVRTLGAMGAGGAVCFASGFREAQAETGDGAALQAALLDAAGDMPLVGPNCYGLINLLDGAALWPDQHGAVRVDRGVALVAQSSNIMLNLTMQRRGLPIAYAATAGNQAQIDLAELGRAMIEDPRVTALGLHIEGVASPRNLEALARTARALGKPIVALKVGASEQARQATISHTASLAGSDAGANALFDRLGIGRVSSLPALLETLKLLHVAGPLPSARIASLSCSGGEAGLMADAALRRDVTFPDLGPTQTAALRAALGPRVALANPLDYHTYIWGDVEALTRAFTAMLDPGLALACLVLDFPRADRCDGAGWAPALQAAGAAQAATGTPMAIVSTLAEGMPEPIAEEIIAAGMVPFCGIDDALEAIAVAAKIGAAPVDHLPILASGPLTADVTLSEAEAKAALAAHGLDVPRSGRAASVQGAVDAARVLGYPLVLKGEGAAHKTEAGLVALGLGDPGAVQAAAAAMPTTGFLVEEMVAGGVAELIVGVLRDPSHGFVLMIGAGGTFAELLNDSLSLLLPVSETGVGAVLDRLRIAPVLAGYRGAPPADRAAIVRAVLAVQAYVTSQAARVVEVEINPLICTPTRAVAADALIRLGGTP